MSSNNTATKPCKCRYSAAIALSSMIGILLSMYALHVEIQGEKDNSYTAMCDISERISCTKVFTSRYGRGFGIIGPILGEDSMLNQPNSLNGIIFYTFIGFLSFVNTLRAAKVQIILCAISNVMSLYLAYLLYFVLEDLCVVCVSTYAVNLANLILAINRFRLLKQDTIMGDERVKSD